MTANFSFVPIVSDDHYKVILRPHTEYDRTRRTEVNPGRGITYVYGIDENLSGTLTEVIEVWFDRARSEWTAASVIRWMERNASNLPAPTTERPAPSGRPVLAG